MWKLQRRQWRKARGKRRLSCFSGKTPRSLNQLSWRAASSTTSGLTSTAGAGGALSLRCGGPFNDGKRHPALMARLFGETNILRSGPFFQHSLLDFDPSS